MIEMSQVVASCLFPLHNFCELGECEGCFATSLKRRRGCVSNLEFSLNKINGMSAIVIKIAITILTL